VTVEFEFGSICTSLFQDSLGVGQKRFPRAHGAEADFARDCNAPSEPAWYSWAISSYYRPSHVRLRQAVLRC
jgi:hypothetical protein